MNSTTYAGTVKVNNGLKTDANDKTFCDVVVSVIEYEEDGTPTETLFCSRIAGKKAQGAAKAIKPGMRMAVTGRLIKRPHPSAGDVDYTVGVRDLTVWPGADPAPAQAQAPTPTPDPKPAAAEAPKPAAAPRPRGPAAPAAAAAAAPAQTPEPAGEGRPW